MRLIKIILASTLVLGVSATTLSASAIKGQKLFVKKLKKPCGMNGAKFAAKHSQDEWEEINSSGKFKDELKNLCPNIDTSKIKDKWLPHIYDFSYEYANDSGNVPSC